MGSHRPLRTENYQPGVYFLLISNANYKSIIKNQGVIKYDRRKNGP
jgi:hypothetical protein